MPGASSDHVLPTQEPEYYNGRPQRPGTFRRTMSTWSRYTTPKRLPWTRWMNSDAKNHFVASMGEFVGTTLFLFFAFAGTMVANIPSGNSADNTTSAESTGPNPSVLLYISLVFGFSLAANVWVFFRVSGGLFNPAVTFAFLLAGKLPLVRSVCLFISQMLGGICAAAIVDVLFPTPLNVRTTLSGGTTIPQGIFIEMFLTAQLVFTIFMLAAEKHRATFVAPVGIGLSLFIAELVGVYYTGGSLNPARSFGPCVAAVAFDKDHWVYWVGPGLGAVIAAGFYKFIKVLEYETANPGQDDGGMDEIFGQPPPTSSGQVVDVEMGQGSGPAFVSPGNQKPVMEKK